MPAVQSPCPRCGSHDIKHKPSACLCSDRHTNPCWSYPKCRRCKYTNGAASANSEGVTWTPFTSARPMSTEITPDVLKKIVKYDHKNRTQA